ncbi:ribosomal protein S6 kinase delta-1 [Sabethes cyaneus]|uniref:ribosomal protein S6 kinase delta-1 n=1 Tax=Sabethes cyaneus TaxID=53552 RepID=UPI00237DCDA1|nr:ribosomal protein S6 kinase delta-1 [Sabethes cyaneus]
MDNHRRKPLNWLHNFNISETRKYKGYTIYKITSIVFPRHLPEALISVTRWKRFSDIKKLYKELARKHRDRHLAGKVPTLSEKTYFKRFDPRIIEERKNYILELLDFVGKEPVLYQSYAFIKFFEQGISPEGTPVKGGNIAAICEDLDIPVPKEIELVDPSRDGSGAPEEVDEGGEDILSVHVESLQSGNGSMENSTHSLASEESDGSEVVDGKVEALESADGSPSEEDPSADYIVQAAIIFSRAMEAEANGDYKVAFEEYKAGIYRLLSGAKSDTNLTRKQMAKEKTCKYVIRAEEIYERYLLYQEDDEILKLSPISLDGPMSPIELLERPLNYLSRYKVVQVIEGRIMQVQDVTDKKFYIMKGIRKPPGGFSQAMFPQDVPYMVPLAAYFQSESSVFLLLKLICGGKLWDYISSYRKSKDLIVENDVENIEEQRNTSDLEAKTLESSNESDSSQTTGYDSGFIDLLNDYNSKKTCSEETNVKKTDRITEEVSEDALEAIDEVDRVEPEGGEEFAPSFDVLSKDMEVSDLVNCSQQLLKAVSQTLEQVQTQPTDLLEISDVPEKLEASDTELPRRPRIDTSQLELRKQEADGCEPDPLPEGCVKRWISELIIAVDALHFNGIICGDLTMDNLLLGAEGQLMLTYFYRKGKFPNAATLTTMLRQDAVQRLYVAPERPLQAKSDFWSVGVILYEMLTRKSFQSCHPAGIFCYHEIQYPEDVDVSEEAKELLDGLLQPLPEHRFDFKEIIASAFFHSIDWSDVKQAGHA